MEAAEGKLFKPLAYTKTFALIASVIVALTIIPPAAQVLFTWKLNVGRMTKLIPLGLTLAGVALMIGSFWLTGFALVLVAAYTYFKRFIPVAFQSRLPLIFNYLVVVVVAWILSDHWLPLGVEGGALGNFIFVALLLAVRSVGFPASHSRLRAHATVVPGQQRQVLDGSGLFASSRRHRLAGFRWRVRIPSRRDSFFFART